MNDQANTNGTDGLLRIGDFARLAGTNLRTLRYYEELGLFEPAKRSEGGFRYYRPTDVNRIELIQGLQGLGLQLENIGELIRTRVDGEGRAQFLSRVRRALETEDQLLADRMNEIQERRLKVAASMAKLTDCDSCTCQPVPTSEDCDPCPSTGEHLPQDLSALF